MISNAGDCSKRRTLFQNIVIPVDPGKTDQNIFADKILFFHCYFLQYSAVSTAKLLAKLLNFFARFGGIYGGAEVYPAVYGNFCRFFQ